MKNLFKNKKFLIAGGIILALIVISLMLVVFLWPDKVAKNDKEKNNEPTENIITKTNSMIVSINPSVKLVYEQTYKECEDDKGKKYICSDISSEVIAFDLQNDDAKNIYKDLDFVGEDLFSVIVILCDTARDNDIGFTELTITTDDDNIIMEDIVEILKTKSEYKTTYTVNVDLKEYIDPTIEGKIKVTFNSDGGTKVTSQVLEKGDKATKPENPKKTGYTFEYWMLDNKEYDFNQKVDEDITLIAKWKEDKKEETKPDNKPNTPSTPTTPTTPDVQKKEEENKTPEVIDTTESRIERINLNENILYYRSGKSAGGACGAEAYYMFATNLESLFPGKVQTQYNGTKYLTIVNQGDLDYFEREYQQYGTPYDLSEYVLESDWLANVGNITYDSAKEANLTSVFSALAASRPAGTTPFKYDYKDHRLAYYSYGSIALEEPNKFITLNNSLNAIKNDLNTKIDNATRGMYFVTYWSGGCGDMPEPELLTEDVCAEYNLVCERW